MNRRLWTEQELAVVRELYPHRPTAEIAERLGRGRTVTKVYAIASKLGLHKSAEYLATQHAQEGARLRIAGAAFRYPKGHVPANKGTRRPGYGPGRMKETQFKKGQISSRWDPELYVVGALRMNADGYVDMKVRTDRKGASNWRAFHVVLWEDAHGPVPPGYALCFKDGDKLNIDVDNNVELISRADLCRRNSLHNLPPELKGAIYMLGALKRRINREKQDRGPAQPPVRNARGTARQGQTYGHRTRKSRCWRGAGDRRLCQG